MRRPRRPIDLAAAVVALGLLAGCGAAEGGTGDSSTAEESHTMPDGTVMERDEHPDEHGSGEHGSGEHGSGSGAEPSMTASMICGGLVADDVNRTMGTTTPVEPTSTWEAPDFTCTFDLPEGRIDLRVHDVDDEAEGRDHFRQRQAEVAGAEPLRGLLGFGLPSFASDRGITAFIRDGKTLEVDATDLPAGPLGPTADQDRRDIAYAVASSVLACWTAHDAHP